MSVQTLRRVSKIDTGTWTQLFPKNVVGTREESLLFVKKLLAVSVSNIMYLRGAFPETAYVDRNLDGLPLKLLNGKSDCRASRDLCSMVRAAHDAIDRTYLRELIVAVFQDPDRPEDAVETYTFNFDYSRAAGAAGDGSGGDDGDFEVAVGFGGGKSGSSSSMVQMKDNVYKSTVSLIRQALQVTKTLQPLPENAFLTILLTYYDDRTPEDYEPPGFGPSLTKFRLERGDVDPIDTSKVSTKHHGFRIQIRSGEFREEEVEPDEGMEEQGSEDVMMEGHGCSESRTLIRRKDQVARESRA